MELRQLAYLAAVAEHGGFTAAADALHVAQPGVSAQVRRLEGELGHELLDRSGRRVRPTAVGEAVLPHARAALAAVAALRDAVDALDGLLRGRVAVGLVPGGPAGFVSDLLGRFNAAHPAVEATLEEGDSESLLALLLDGRLDLVVAGRAAPPPAGVAAATLLEEPLAAAVAPEHPLASRASD
ncbi:LysR family transcriptional regulator, partial [Conexibacter sp. JD483]